MVRHCRVTESGGWARPSGRPFVRRALPVACAGLCAALLAWPARATDWVVGRTPEVFHPEADEVATRVGGWVDLSYEDNDLETSTRSINVNHLNFFVDTRYRDTWQLFLEGEFENESNLTGFEDEREYEVEQVYLRYRLREGTEARVGKFNTPFGFWTPLHWTILMDTIRAPIHEDQRITPEQQYGVSLTGRLALPRGTADLRYSAYMGYGNDSELLEESGSDGYAAGGDVRLELDEDSFVGVSYYQQQREQENDRSERSMALYGQLPISRTLLLRGEYIRQTRDANARPSFERKVNIIYAKLRWQLAERMYLNYRFNWGDNDDDVQTSTRYAHTLTYGYDLTSKIRMKVEYADHRFRDSTRRDFRYWGLSFGAFF